MNTETQKTPDAVLESTYSNPEDYVLRTLKSGRIISIADHNFDFFQQLSKLPAADLVELLNISAEDLNKILDNQTDENSVKLQEFLSAKWKDRYCGERYRFDDPDINDDLFGMKLTLTQIKGKFKRNTLSSDQVNNLVNFFETTEDYYY